MRVRMLTAIGLVSLTALAACAVPGQRETTVTSYNDGYNRAYERTDRVTPPTPAWARPGYDHSNFDSRTP
jgi:hypothetical protein